MNHYVRVLHVLNSCSGGATLSTLELIKSLAPMGIESSILAMDNGSLKEKQIITTLVEGRALFLPLYWMNKKIRAKLWKRPFIELYWLLKTWRGYRYQVDIREFISINNIQIVHTSTSLTPEGAIAAKSMAIPHIWHIRELIGPLNPFQFNNYSRFGDLLEDYSSVIIANSKSTQTAISRYLKKDKLVYIPNGIDPELFSNIESEDTGSYTVAMIGSVTSQWKNHRFFIEVAAELKNFKNLSFKIYGSLPINSNPYYSQLLKLIEELRMLNKVSFEGFIKDPSEIMSGIDIMFHPTGKESFGRIFLEALASGIPVVAIADGGAMEMIEDGVNGFLIIDGDKKAAVDKLTNLLNDPEKRRMFGQKGRSKVKESFSLSNLSNKMKLIYESLG